MSVSASCQRLLNDWCNANCPHYYAHGPLVAAFSRGFGPTHLPTQWRCFARHTLDAGGTQYQQGREYCTRHAQLLDQLRLNPECDARASATATRESEPVHATVTALGTSEKAQMGPLRATSTATLAPANATVSDLENAAQEEAQPPRERDLTSVSKDAPLVWLDALVSCSRKPRCSCLQHGTVASSDALFTALPSVAFFVLLPDATAADQLVERLAARNVTNVYVLTEALGTIATSPMRNDVLNPGETRKCVSRRPNSFATLCNLPLSLLTACHCRR